MDHIDIRKTRLSVEEASDKVTSPSSGAVSLFVGKLTYIPPGVFWGARWADNAIHFALEIFQIMLSPIK